MVRGQGSNPGAGNLVIFVPFCFSHHIFLLADDTSLISSYTDTHIIYNRLDCMHFLKNYNRGKAFVDKFLRKNKRRQELLERNSKSEWTKSLLTNRVNCKPLHAKDILFVPWKSSYVFRPRLCGA